MLNILLRNKIFRLFNDYIDYLLFTNFIVGKINIANTICLPVDSLGETWDNKAVSVAGWGYTKLLEEGEWHPSPKIQVGDGRYCSYSSDYQMFNLSF